MGHDIRWIQRFQNFKRAFLLLSQVLTQGELDELSDLEQEGVIQRFEYSFELAWKTLKDYLDYSGFVLKEATPRRVIKECAASGIFAEAEINAEAYLAMLLTRNTLSHMYDSEQFKKALVEIKGRYLAQLERQYQYLLQKESEAND